MPLLLAETKTEIHDSAHAHSVTKALTIASTVGLQVVRTSFGFHLREYYFNTLHSFLYECKF